MKAWTVFSKGGKSIFIDWSLWEERQAREWIKDHEKQIADPESLYFGAYLELREWESEDERHARQVQDLAMLVRMLSNALKKAKPSSTLHGRAMSYLQREGLTGSVLRAEAPVEG